MFKYVFKLLTVVFIIAGVAACSGGGGSSDPEVIVPEAQVLKSVTGVFADDAPIARAVVTVIDAAGVTREVTTDDNGLYYIEVNDLELPLLVVGSYTSGGVVHTQYSFVSADKSSADTLTANINEYSSLLVSAMTQEAGVAIDTAPESLSDANRNLILGVDYLPAIASMEKLFCSILLNPDGTTQGCEWGSSEDILTTSYVPTVDGNSIDKLVALMDVTVDTTTGNIIIADSSGVPVATISLNDIVADTIPVDTLTPTDIENINTFYTPPTEITPIENEAVSAQLTTSGTVRGVTKYDGNFPATQVFVDNLTECPVESRNFVVTAGDNAQTPVVHFAEFNLEIDTSPELVPVVSRTDVSPIEACRSYAFDYQFDYNMVIRKTQTGLVDGVPVWEYDVPACEQYSNKTIEAIQQKTYQYTDVDFDLLLDLPTIEVRPALHRYSESWPNSSVNFVYDPTCPMVAEFSVSPTEGTPSLTVNVDASNSVGNLVSFEWEVTGGQAANDKITSFTFDTAGTYTITLTVTDTNGQTDVLSKTVIVDPLPQAAFTSTLGSASNQIELNAVNSTGTGISYSWTANDAIDGKTRIDQNVDFTFAVPGDYTVTLVVTDKYENISETSKVITVQEVVDNGCNGLYPDNGSDSYVCTTAADGTLTVKQYTNNVLTAMQSILNAEVISFEDYTCGVTNFDCAKKFYKSTTCGFSVCEATHYYWVKNDLVWYRSPAIFTDEVQDYVMHEQLFPPGEDGVSVCGQTRCNVIGATKITRATEELYIYKENVGELWETTSYSCRTVSDTYYDGDPEYNSCLATAESKTTDFLLNYTGMAIPSWQ